MMPWVILPLETAFKMIHWGCPVGYKEMDGFNNTPLPQNIPQKFTVSYLGLGSLYPGIFALISFR